jgi:glycosyltransferase involved in cell wall biosynthesis
VQGSANVRYHGWLGGDALPLHFRAVDVIYYCLRLDYPGAVYNAPNTLSHAMLSGRPIIANDVGDLGRMVRSTGCGLLIDKASPETIAGAVAQLKDPALRARLGARGLEAARNAYNAESTQQQLVHLYDSLMER